MTWLEPDLNIPLYNQIKSLLLQVQSSHSGVVLSLFIHYWQVVETFHHRKSKKYVNPRAASIKTIIQQTCKKVCKKLSVLCIVSAAICPRAPSPRTCNTNCAWNRRRTKSQLGRALNEEEKKIHIRDLGSLRHYSRADWEIPRHSNVHFQSSR